MKRRSPLGYLNSFPSFSAVLLALVLMPFASPAVAEDIFRDEFAVDGPLAGTAAGLGGVWTQTGTQGTNPIQIANGAATLVPFGQDLYSTLTIPVASAPHTAIQTSLDLKVDEAQSGGEYFLHLSDPVATTTLFYERLFARASANGYQLGLLDSGGSGSRRPGAAKN